MKTEIFIEILKYKNKLYKLIYMHHLLSIKYILYTYKKFIIFMHSYEHVFNLISKQANYTCNMNDCLITNIH